MKRKFTDKFLKRNREASEVLKDVISHNAHVDYITLDEIRNSMHERGFGLLMLFFSLPLSIPMPVPPGITLLPAIPLLIFSVQMIIGMDAPWLPKWLGKKSIKRTTLALLVEKASPALKKIEKLLRPRLSFASSSRGERWLGIFSFVCALSIANPVPLSNMVPAIGISLMSLGLLSRDGILMIIGMIVGITGVALSILIIILGKAVVMSLISNVNMF